MAHRFLPLLILFAACTVVHESDDPGAAGSPGRPAGKFLDH